ncbi:MAG: PEP-CTERM sorting domain-containing protein, partial [Verrucomicrobiia bacterium]
MKLILVLTLGCLPLWPALTDSEEYFVYDQVSPVPGAPPGSAPQSLQSGPIGQSFTPSLPALDFIELWTGDGVPGNRLGATVYVVLRSDSITGPIISSTDPVFLSDGFGWFENEKQTMFFFSPSVALAPGQTYYFQVLTQPGSDWWHVVGYNSYRYPGGMMYGGSEPVPGMDLWFRTGIVVPEPSTVVLVLLGLPALVWGFRASSQSRSGRHPQERPRIRSP